MLSAALVAAAMVFHRGSISAHAEVERGEVDAVGMAGVANVPDVLWFDMDAAMDAERLERSRWPAASAARRFRRKSAAAAPGGGRGVVNSADPSQGRLGGELGHGGDGCHHTWSGGLHLRYTAPTTFRASRQSVAATPDERLGVSVRFFRSLVV